MQVSDRITGGALTVLGVSAVIGGLQLPNIPGQDVGPAVFPAVIGGGLALCGVLVFAGVGSRYEADALAELAAHEDTPAPPRGLWRLAIPPALLLFYVLVVGRLGFVPTAAIMVLTAALALGARRLALPLAVVAPLVVHFLFAKLLRVPLPAGLLPMPW